MSSGIIKRGALFLLIMHTPTIFSQENFIPTDYQKNNFYNNPNFVQTNPNSSEISISLQKITGDWKKFKNWNEGNAVVAESDSIVWVGTPVGLVRWNVKKSVYKTFDENNGLYFTTVNSLAIDQSEKLWIATRQGLAVYKNGIFTHYDHTNSPLPNASMDAVSIDHLNRVVIAYGPTYSGEYNFNSGGIARLDNIEWKFWDFKSERYWGATSSIQLYQNKMWIAGDGSLLILTEDSLYTAPGWTFEAGYSIAVDYQDSLWVESSMRKTVKYTNNGWKVIIDRDLEGMGGLFYDIWNDPRGGLWLSMKDLWWCGYGPYRLDFEKRILGIYCETNYVGICTIPGIPGQFYAHYALSANEQFFVSKGTVTYEWPNSTISQGGLYRFNGSSWKIYRVPTTLLKNEIYGLGKGKEGNVYWFSEKWNLALIK